MPVHSASPRRIFEGDDAALVRAFRHGDRAAREEFHDRYSGHVHRVLLRLLGADTDLADLHHDVFVRALRSLPRLEQPAALKGWLTAITVHVARSAIAHRRRRRWLWLMPHDEVPDVVSKESQEEAVEALRATYAVLDELSVDERIAFALRFIDGMELTDVAAACGISLSTAKRRLRRAGKRFVAKTRRHPLLAEWLEEGDRWSPTNNR